MATNPEAFIEIKNFKKKVKNFLGQLDIECDNFSEIDEISEEGTQQVVSVELQKRNNQNSSYTRQKLNNCWKAQDCLNLKY